MLVYFKVVIGVLFGYRMRESSISPVRHRNEGRHYSPEFDHSRGPLRGRGFFRGRNLSRYRDYSPYGHGSGRLMGRGFDGPRFGAGSFRGDGALRNNPNVRPREGDWMCPDPVCNNLNFARREFCNNCKRPRYPSGLGMPPPRRGYPGPPPPLPRRFPGPPANRSPPVRSFNGYHRSPPRGGFVGGPPHPPPPRRDRLDYFEDEYRERGGRLERPAAMNLLSERKGYDRRNLSPNVLSPPAQARDRWVREERERSMSPVSDQWVRDERDSSRSPVRGGIGSGGGGVMGPPLAKEYQRDVYLERGRDERRGLGHEAY